MKSGWEDWKAQCPFYHSETANSVQCCGWEPDMRLTLTFARREDCAEYKKEICRSKDGYLTCPLYDVLADMTADG